MADVIIKPATGGNLILQDDGGTAALTIDTSGDIQLTGSMTAGALGSAVIIPQATTKKIHRWVFGERIAGNASANNNFKWGEFKPLDPVNNSFWLEGFVPVDTIGQDQVGFGVRFIGHDGGSDVDYLNKGVWYCDNTSPSSSMGVQNYCFGVAAGVFVAGRTYDIWHRLTSANSNPSWFNPRAIDDARLHTKTESHLIIYEYKNNL